MTTANKKPVFLDNATVLRRVSKMETDRKNRPAWLQETLVSAAYHVAIHGNITGLNRLLSAVSASERKYMILALLSVSGFFAKGAGATAEGIKKHVVLDPAIKASKENTKQAEKLAGLIPFWEQVKLDAIAKKKSEAEKLKAEAEAENPENPETENPENPENPETSVPASPFIRDNIASLASNIRKMLADNFIADTDADIAASFLQWYESLQTATPARPKRAKNEAVTA